MDKMKQLKMTGSPMDLAYVRVVTAVYNDPAIIPTSCKFVGTDTAESTPNLE